MGDASGEVILSENAKQVLARSRGKRRRALVDALKRIEADPAWDGQLRFIAPARPSGLRRKFVYTWKEIISRTSHLARRPPDEVGATTEEDNHVLAS